MALKEQPALVLRDVHRDFVLGETTVHALCGVTFEVLEGEFVVILGPSGSGKTTLLNQIGGIDSPTKGVIKIKGEEITQWGPAKLSEYRRHRVGWIFQFFNLIPSLRAWENVGLALEFKGGQNNVKERSCEILKAVGLGDKVNRFPSQLSGGEQQRVAIARALVKSPDIIVADEPTGNLDFVTGKKIAELLKRLNEESHGTYVIVSHDSTMKEIAGRVFHLRDGRIDSGYEYSVNTKY